jgi:hypothetical protein
MKSKAKRKPNLTPTQLSYLRSTVLSPSSTFVPRGVAQSLLKKGFVTPYIVWGRGVYLLKYQATGKAVQLVRNMSA